MFVFEKWKIVVAILTAVKKLKFAGFAMIIKRIFLNLLKNQPNDYFYSNDGLLNDSRMNELWRI